MKFLLLSLSLLTFSHTSSAQVAEAITVGSAAGSATFGVGNVVMTSSRRCNMGASTDGVCEAGAMSTLYSPVSSLLISLTAGFNKEEIAMIKNDSLLLVAGFEKTLALEEFIQDLRSEAQELETLSDEEIALNLALTFE